ncbi:MAG: ABC transporter substrate-binding protein [Synergistaceae bacterium]|jgi:NitT/TauT family transport system substrate-binding protein|nr:ABC transporter substrate-binding protein [Synergistaceae bacterium]
MRALKKITAVTMLFFLSFVFSALGAETLPTIRVGVMAGETDSFVPAVGEELGIYKKYGLNVISQAFSAGINTIDALTLGQLDFGMAADFAILNRIGAMEKSDLRIYTKFAVSKAGTPFSWAFYVNDDTVTSPSDLAGKSIALRKGTVEEYWTARLLQTVGVDPVSIKQLPIGSPQEGVAALKSKQATGMWGGGQASVALAEIPSVRGIADLATIDSQTVTVLLSTQKFLTENKDIVVNYVKALEEIVRFINAEPEKTAEIVQKQINIPAEQVLMNLQRNEISVNFTQTTLDTLDAINQWGRGAGFIKNVFDVRDYVNVEALKEAFPESVSYDHE